MKILKIYLIFLIFIPRPLIADEQTKLSNCGVTPAFAMKMAVSNPVFSTRDRFRSGIVMFKLQSNGELSNSFQLPSWITAGRLGAFTVDEIGNIFVVPSASVNTLLNPPEKQNWLYWINSQDGVLEPFIKLAVQSPPSQVNPYGLLGIAYDCQSKIIYLSTVSGSTQQRIAGEIIAISKTDKSIIARYSGIDALSLGIFQESDGKKLYIGLARESKVKKLPLVTGVPKGNLQDVLTLDKFGIIKARKLRFKEQTLEVETTEFNYNLIAQTEFESRTLSYKYNKQYDRWE